MENIKNNYTNFILTVIAVVMLAMLFKGNVISNAHAWSYDPSIPELEVGSGMKEHHNKMIYLVQRVCGKD